MLYIRLTKKSVTHENIQKVSNTLKYFLKVLKTCVKVFLTKKF